MRCRTEPTPLERLAEFGVAPWLVGFIFTTATIMYGLSASLVSWVSNLVPVRRVMAGGTICMALSLSLLGLAPNAFLAAIDRLGLTCYAAVYAVNNIANSIGMVVTDALTSAVTAELGFLNALLCAAPSLLVCTPVFLQKETAKAAVH